MDDFRQVADHAGRADDLVELLDLESLQGGVDFHVDGPLQLAHDRFHRRIAVQVEILQADGAQLHALALEHGLPVSRYQFDRAAAEDVTGDERQDDDEVEAEHADEERQDDDQAVELSFWSWGFGKRRENVSRDSD